MEDSNHRHIPWTLFVSELTETALLALVGLSLVTLVFGTGSPMARLIPLFEEALKEKTNG